MPFACCCCPRIVRLFSSQSITGFFPLYHRNWLHMHLRRMPSEREEMADRIHLLCDLGCTRLFSTQSLLSIGNDEMSYLLALQY